MTIKFQFAADVSEVTRGTADIADRFDAVADQLVDLAKDGDRAGDALGDSLQEGGKAAGKLEKQLQEAQDAARDLGKGKAGAAQLGDGLDAAGKDARSFQDKASDAFKKVSDDARDSGKVVGSATQKGAREASQATGEFKDEAKANLSEVASSFSGGMDSAVDLVQGTLGGLVSALGPAGLVGAAVGAVGIGLAKAFAEGEAERINAMGDAVNALSVELRGVEGDLSQVNFDQYMEDWGLAIQDTREWWELWQEKAETGLDKIARLSKSAGQDFTTAFRGTKGSLEDSQKALDQVNVLLEDATKNATMYVDASSGMQYMNTGDKERIDALKELKKGYEDNISVQAQAVENNKLLEQAGVRTAEAIAAEEQAVEDANDALAEHANKLAEAAGAALGADQAELDYADTLKQSTEDIKANGKATDINTAAGAANRQTLIDLAQSANELIAAQVAQGGSTADVTAKANAARDSFIRQAEAAGYTNEEARKLADRYGLIPKNVDTMVKAHNVQQTKDEIDGVAKPRNATINLIRGGESITDWIRGLSNQEVPVMLRPRQGAPLP